MNESTAVSTIIPTDSEPVTPGDRRSSRGIAPLWVAAISLAVIAITLIIGLIEIGHALSTTQTAVEQLQQQVQQLRQGFTGLGGLLGG